MPRPKEVGWALRARLPGQERFRRAYYWERRARDLIRTYDDPSSWESRRWLRGGVEENVVPQLLKAADVRSVLVVGCGSGREFMYLEPHGFALSGFDISPTMVETCRRRYPAIYTEVGSVVDAGHRFEQVDAVVSSGVLTHVSPDDISGAISTVTTLARRLIVLREKTRFEEASTYEFHHDYEKLLRGWRCVHREITDERDTWTAELMAWRRN